jgi:hypothetical protein
MKFMSYCDWFETHANKHHAILQKLQAKNLTSQEMIDYFNFENMVVCEPDFCPLYANKQKCHDVAYLSCFLCACPFFRFNDEGLCEENGMTVKSTCAICAKHGQKLTYENVIHQDCSLCFLPHTKGFVKKHFDVDWKTIMKACAVTSPKV